MRTVRLAARARNQPRGPLILVVLAALVALAVLVARADAGPRSQDPDLDGEPVFDDELDVTWSRASDRGIRDESPCPCDRDALSRIAASAPAVAIVVAAALRAAGLADDPAPSWRQRSRWSSLVPWVTARAGNSQSWREVTDPTISHALAYDVRVAWRLDRLVFDPTELRISAYDIARRRDRRYLAAQATRAFYAWLRLQAAAEQDPRWRLRASEATAQLDALTAGEFSEITRNRPQ